MNAMSNAEKQRAYRERIAARKVADELFDGQMVMTLGDFLEGVEFDAQAFFQAVSDLDGEETEDCQEERQAIWQEAYDEAYKEAYSEEYQAALGDGFDPDEGEDDDIRESADETAREAADEAVKEWEQGIEDYEGSCMEYLLVDLLQAYREAHALM